jgi:hypothetical protein
MEQLEQPGNEQHQQHNDTTMSNTAATMEQPERQTTRNDRQQTAGATEATQQQR